MIVLTDPDELALAEGGRVACKLFCIAGAVPGGATTTHPGSAEKERVCWILNPTLQRRFCQALTKIGVIEDTLQAVVLRIPRCWASGPKVVQNWGFIDLYSTRELRPRTAS